MSEVATLTELEAVNQMLDTIDESPVSSLVSGLPDAEKAERMLDQVRREVLAKGWNCNRERELTLAKDGSDEIIVGADVLRLKPVGTDKGEKITIRADAGLRKIYDVKNRTFTWSKDLKCDVIYLFAFTDLEPELQMYIAALAGRKYQESSMGSVALDNFVNRNVTDAWAALQDAEAESESDNILTDSPHVYWITRRNNRIYGT